MVVLDPHTGAVLALVGGRDYGFSQLNHVLSQSGRRVPFFETVRLCRGHEYRSGWLSDGDHAGLDRDRWRLPVSPTAIRIYEPRNYKEEIPRRCDPALRSRHVTEQRHRETG